MTASNAPVFTRVQVRWAPKPILALAPRSVHFDRGLFPHWRDLITRLSGGVNDLLVTEKNVVASVFQERIFVRYLVPRGCEVPEDVAESRLVSERARRIDVWRIDDRCAVVDYAHHAVTSDNQRRAEERSVRKIMRRSAVLEELVQPVNLGRLMIFLPAIEANKASKIVPSSSFDQLIDKRIEGGCSLRAEAHLAAEHGDMAAVSRRFRKGCFANLGRRSLSDHSVSEVDGSMGVWVPSRRLDDGCDAFTLGAIVKKDVAGLKVVHIYQAWAVVEGIRHLLFSTRHRYRKIGIVTQFPCRFRAWRPSRGKTVVHCLQATLHTLPTRSPTILLPGPGVPATAGRLCSYRVLSLQRPHKVPGMPDIQVISATHAFFFATPFNGAYPLTSWNRRS